MVTTHRAALSERLRLLAHHGIDRAAWQREDRENNWQYSVGDTGFKFNLSDLQSAMGLEQLKKQETFLATRLQYARLYDEELKSVEGLDVPSQGAAGHCRHLYQIGLRAGNRDRFIREMKNQGVSCSVHFIPIPLHPFFAEAAKRLENDCPCALELYARSVSLPLYPAMSADDVRYVAWCAREMKNGWSAETSGETSRSYHKS